MNAVQTSFYYHNIVFKCFSRARCVLPPSPLSPSPTCVSSKFGKGSVVFPGDKRIGSGGRPRRGVRLEHYRGGGWRQQERGRKHLDRPRPRHAWIFSSHWGASTHDLQVRHGTSVDPFRWETIKRCSRYNAWGRTMRGAA